MEITRAEKGDIPRLKELWRDCFAADEAYNDLFFEGRFAPEDTLVARVQGRAEAMLYRLSLTFPLPNGRTLKGRYVYAVGTAPACRGMGLSSALLEAHHRICREEGEDVSLLVPAGPELFGFYEKRGFSTCFYTQREEVSAVAGDIPFRPGNLAECAPLRERRFGRSALFGRWDGAALTYAQEESEAQGGRCLAFPGGYVVARPVGDTLLWIAELVPGAYAPEEVAAQATAYLGRERGQFFRWPFEGGEAQPYAMAAFYTSPPHLASGLPPYFGLPLD